MDLFKFHSRHKRECSFCGKYRGENEWLKKAKREVRRHARHQLKDLLRRMEEEDDGGQ